MRGDLFRVYPNNGRIQLDGGKNSKFERSIIADNESPDCANVEFSNGAVGTREGSQKLNTASVGSFVIDGLYTRRTRTSSETMMVWAGGTCYDLQTTSFITIPSAQSVFTAGVRVGAAQYENHIFYGNGGSIPYKWNGTNFTRHGVYPPTTTMSVASNSTGVLSGDYRYKVTYVNTQSVESDVGPVTSTYVASSNTLRITSLPTAAASWGVAARRIYRTVTSGSTFLRVAEVADNTTTTYDDNIADASLGTTAPTNHGVPPLYNAIIYHQNRLFMNDPSNPNWVVWTDLGEPYTVNTGSNFQAVGDDSSDIVYGFGVYDNSLVVFCEKSITIAYMSSTTPSDWRWVTVRSPYGSKSPYAIIRYKNKLLFPAMDNDKFVGFAALAGDTVDPSATLLTVSNAGSDLKSNPIEPDVFDGVESKVGNISAISYKNKAFITFTKGTGQTLNNRIYQFDYSISNLDRKQEGAWVPWTGLSAAQFTIYAGNLYYGSSTATGFVYKLYSGLYNDDGAAIDSYFWTKEFSGIKTEVNNNKDFRALNMLVDNAGGYFMNLTYRVDSDRGSGNTVQVDLDPGGSLWGTMVFGRDNWGGGTDQTDIKQPLGTARGKRIQFKFSNQNTVNQRFKVHGINFSYNLKGIR